MGAYEGLWRSPAGRRCASANNGSWDKQAWEATEGWTGFQAVIRLCGGAVTAVQVPRQNASPEDRALEPSRPQWLCLWYPSFRPLAGLRVPASIRPGSCDVSKGLQWPRGKLCSRNGAGRVPQPSQVFGKMRFSSFLDAGKYLKSRKWRSPAAKSFLHHSLFRLSCLSRQRWGCGRGDGLWSPLHLPSHPQWPPSAAVYSK